MNFKNSTQNGLGVKYSHQFVKNMSNTNTKTEPIKSS